MLQFATVELSDYREERDEEGDELPCCCDKQLSSHSIVALRLEKPATGQFNSMTC